METKLILFFLALLAVIRAPLFAGGGRQAAPAAGSQGAVLSAPGQFPLVNQKTELAVLTMRAPRVSDFNDNEFTKWYENLTNIHVNYVSVPEIGDREAANLLLAAGEYPDVIMHVHLNDADVINYGNQGIFIPLNDLLDKHGYFLKKSFERYPDLPQALYMPDGNIYGLPNINDAYHSRYTQKAWINEKWLAVLNLKTPTTTDEFYTVLKAFKTRDPNGNGRADEIPMMGAYQQGIWRLDPYVFLLNSFVYFDPDTGKPSGFLEMNNGRVGFVPMLDDYREGLRYIAKLISEDLLDPASLTQNLTQFKRLGTNVETPLLGVFTDFIWGNAVGSSDDTPDRRADYYPALAPLAGPKGVRYTPLESTPYGTAMAVITDHCKDPALAMRWLDGLFNEDVTKASQFGIKGVNWDDAPRGSLGINGEPAIWQILQPLAVEGDRNTGRDVFIGNRYSELRLGQLMDFSDPLAQFETEPKLYRETRDKYVPYAAPDKVVPRILYFTPQEVTEYSRLKEQINTYARENLIAFITGNKNPDRDWNSYIAEFQKLELTRYLQYVQTAYDRQYGRK
jgi:putative aldouronate transport system substrate-binding protein